MQIFRPYVDWSRSAAVLDDLRLGKQRVEAKQILNIFLRKAGLLRDGLRGWLNHPIVLLYYNGGRPYVDDVIGMFNACVREWVRRGKQSSINLDDVKHLLDQLEKTPGTPITHLHEIEYRRILLLKKPSHYIKAFTEEEVREVLETKPIRMNGINSWIFDDMPRYRRMVKKLVKIYSL